jgi:uncharacterized protein YjiS (DUF1127 family)
VQIDALPKAEKQPTDEFSSRSAAPRHMPRQPAVPAIWRPSVKTFISAILLRQREHARKTSVAHLNDRLLADIGLYRQDLHSGRILRRGH